MTDDPGVVMEIGERAPLLSLKVYLSRGHDRGVRIPAVRVARDEDERAGVSGDRLVRGRSMRDVEAALAKALGDQAAISKSTVSAIRGQIKDKYQTPGPSAPGRRETGLAIPGCFLLPDASWLPGRTGAGRVGHHHRRQASLHRPGPGTGESFDAWKDFLSDLRDRGLASPVLVVSDGAAVLIGAVKQVRPKALRQRCVIHRCRNLLAGMPAEVKDAYWKIFDTEDVQDATRSQARGDHRCPHR